MSQVSYESIQPLVAHAQRDGSVMRVTFQCPVSAATFETSAGLRAANTVANRASQGVKRSLLWSLRSAVSSAVRGAFGHGAAGYAASGAAYGAMSGVGSAQSYSADDERDAIVRAFESVRGQFVWDPRTNRFISALAAGETMTDFMRQLGAGPITSPYDRGILARMLCHLASADGHIGPEEREFLAGFLTPDLGTADSLAQMPPPSAAELAETARGPSRESMIMLGWAMAFTDETLSPGEVTELGNYAHQLGISEQRVAELRGYAQVYVVDQALARAYPGGRRDDQAHGEALMLAHRIGLDETAAERVDIRFRKRHGLM